MRTFPLRIGTPDGLLFEGEVQRVVCRSITGDMAIMAGHCNFCTALGMGEAHVILEDGSNSTERTISVVSGRSRQSDFVALNAILWIFSFSSGSIDFFKTGV